MALNCSIAFIESVAIAEDPDMSSRDMLKVSLIIKTSTRELKLKAGDDIRHSMWFEVKSVKSHPHVILY